ncbi:MAG TPA: S41 family peptidase [Thermoguttaceae bacterium]|nr:S41 family peptidase [Thermoguttaceae bacterium]
MPRRNIHLIVGLTVLCLMCAARTSRYGRVLTYAMNQVNLRYLEDVSRQELFEGALEGMMHRLDDYSAYISPELLVQFQEDLGKEFGGVGIEIILDPETKDLTVASPLVGTPAYEAGILAGDKVRRIDGESTQGLSIQDAADRMRGKPGEPVTLTILHPGEEQPVDVEIVRAIIRVDTVLGDTRNEQGEWDYFLEGYDHIGYVRVNSFSEQTDKELRRALDWLVQRDVQGLILDLRNDPGGMLGTAIGVCDLFIDSGVIVTTRRRDGQINQASTATKRGTYSGFPMAVLVNGFSASASEIVAACLQDHGRAVVVGQRSFGKGTVQELIPLEAGQGILKLTTASYWRPSEKNIHRRSDAGEDDDWGVRPNKGYEVDVDKDQFAKLLNARFRRDARQRNHEQDSTAEDDPADPDVDPQLAKAVEYIRQKLEKR